VRLRVYILTHDEQIFSPRFFHSILSSKPGQYDVFGAAMVHRTKKETAVSQVKYLYRLAGVRGVVAIAGRLAWQRFAGMLPHAGPSSLRDVFAAHRIPLKEIPSPNQPEFVEWLRTQQPDILYCSITNLLKAPILATPRLGCVNRHSGRLPDYRGSEPVFHALRRAEKSVSVTIHSMVEELDGGTVLWEHTEPVRGGDSVFSLYARLFEAASSGFWTAIAALPSGGLRTIDPSSGALHKRPTPDQIREFREQGRRYI
jgi:methionyl-tRNA formyltransferase